MPAKKGDIVHVYNKATGNNIMFAADEDYVVFLSYLKEYLTPLDSESFKKEFTVKGRTFKGKAHMPKNYFGEIELAAYALMSDHFHLVLVQNKDRAVEKFMRSISTRYSMYFNKKYKRSGALFQGAYKSAVIEKQTVGSLIHFVNDHKAEYSSLGNYQNKDKSLWLKKIEVSKSAEKMLPEAMTLEEAVKDLEKTQAQHNLSGVIPDSPVYSLKISAKERLREKRVPEMIASLGVFLILFSIGFRNMTTYATEFTFENIENILGVQIETQTPEPTNTPSATPVPTSTPTETYYPTPSPMSTNVVVVNVSDDSSINILELPSTNAEIVGEAKTGDSFELLSNEGQWYEVKLSDNLSGFISSEYVLLESEDL